MIEPKVFSVGQINRYIKNLLENDFILNSLLVQGEISNFKAHSSGHWYFTLKDAQGAISCVIFRQDAANIPFEPENGMQVILGGYISLYEKTGQYQFYGEFLQPVGMGSLQIAFEQMKEKLGQKAFLILISNGNCRSMWKPLRSLHPLQGRRSEISFRLQNAVIPV